jgi:hypothetical protein
MASIVTERHRLFLPITSNPNMEKLVVEFGTAAFTEDEVAVELDLEYLQTVFNSRCDVLQATMLYPAESKLDSDNELTEGAITVCRSTTEPGAVSFQFWCVGEARMTRQ